MKAKRFLMILLSLVTLTAWADNVGNCGDQGNNVTYSWDPTTKTLTFSGSGRMADFSENSQPWNTCAGATTVEYVVVGEGITYIGKYAFNHYYNLYGVDIASTVTEIGKDAFGYTSGLAYVRFKGTTLPKLENNNVFHNAPEYRKFLVNKSYVIPTDGKWDPNTPDDGTDQPRKYINEIDGSCGNHVWYKINNGELSVMGWGDMTNYTEENRAPWDSAASSFTTLSIEGRVSHIGNYAFRNFNNITSVTIPNTVEKIGKYVFHNCNTLTAITLPNSLTTINDHAFNGCAALKSIVLGSGLKAIGGAFSGCTAVSDIHCYANPTTLAWATSENEFKSGEEKTKCHVASGAYDTWTTNFSKVNVTFVGDLGTELTGEGTVSNPYLLWSACDLVRISDRFNSADETVVATVKGKYFQQIANLEFDKNTANNYTPIAQFDGDYNGNGYLISGLNVNVSGNAALFLTMAEGSKVYNVIIKNSSIQGSQAAAIACVLGTSATITNCHVLKDVTIRANNYYAGGLVAHMNGGTPTVEYCSSHATLYADQSNAGGVVGAVTNDNCSVVNSVYLGTADNIHYGAGKSGYAICQNSGGTVDNCYYTASTLNDANNANDANDANDVYGENGKLVLANMEVNSDFLEMMMERDEFLQLNSGLATSDINYNLTLNGRTLFKETNEWQTLCLPFSVSNFTGTPLERAIVKTFTGSSYDNSFGGKELTLNFSADLTSIEAGKPYIVKWNPTYATENEEDCENPKFENVTVGAATGSAIGSMLVDFVGTLSPVSVKANNKNLLYMGHNNKLHYSSNGTTIGSCRSYFLLSSSNNEVNQARILLNFGDGEVTAIENINRETITNNQYYDLQGRKLDGQPTQKGLYIVNGKKMIVK